MLIYLYLYLSLLFNLIYVKDKYLYINILNFIKYNMYNIYKKKYLICIIYQIYKIKYYLNFKFF